MSEPFIIFGKPQILEEDINSVTNVLRSGWIGTGPITKEFEEEFARLKAVKAALALNSCTSGLHLALKALDLGKDAEVITSPLTFCATVNTIIHAGYRPVLADVEMKTQNIDPLKIEAAITPKTKALLPVHFGGRMANMDQIMALAKKHNLKVIEDCAHAIETTRDDLHAGTFADFGCFSFYVTKNVSTAEGGMIIAQDLSLLDRLRISSLHGMSKHAYQRFGPKGYSHYEVLEAGFKYNMTDVHAAIGLGQLKRVQTNWVRRQKIWNHYQAELKDLPIILPAEAASNEKHAYHLYTLMVDQEKTGLSRDDCIQRMTERGIGTGVHYRSIPEHSFYQRAYGWRPQDWPNASRIGRQTLSIPLSPSLTDLEVERVVSGLKKILGR